MDAREHHLPVARVHQAPHLLQDILRPAAAHPAPGVGDGAVGAELVAAVLDLDIGPGALRRVLQPHLLIFVGIPDVQDGGALQGLVPLRAALPPSLQILLQDGRDVLLPVVADGKVYARIRLHGLPPRLHIAAHRHHHSVGIELPGTVQHLSALPVRDVGDRTCVHDIDIGSFIKCHNAISFFPEDLAHYFHFIGIDLAAQIIQCHSFHDYSPLFCTVFALTFAPPAVNMLTGR